MLARASSKRLCSSCSTQLLDLFVRGLVAPAPAAHPRKHRSQNLPHQRRLYHSTLRPGQGGHAANSNVPNSSKVSASGSNVQVPAPSAEERVLFAREAFGETLPEGYLSHDEFQLYERLFGPPTAVTKAEDEALLQPLEDEVSDAAVGEAPTQNTLFKETEEGELQEVDLEGDDYFAGQELDLEKLLRKGQHESEEQFEQRRALYEAVAQMQNQSQSADDANAMFEDLQSTENLVAAETGARDTGSLKADIATGASVEDCDWEGELGVDSEEIEEESSRFHPLSAAGHFGSAPSTIRAPAVEFTEPIQRHLAMNARYEHLKEAAFKDLGGQLMPNTNATPRRSGGFEQKPVALTASQFKMSQIEANLFMATIMPGAYASSKGIMIEVRKRLGSEWLESVMTREGGPRILDAGSGGAAVIAWRELLHAQWETMHEDQISQGSVPYGSSTVLAGSQELRDAVSDLLEETTFIPRLPEFSRRRDLPAERPGDAPNRKRYDIIVAPYSLYSSLEGFERKAQVQNLWSLLEPKGGVLILIEKGIPRGFEAVAEAREVLLKHHIRNPDTVKQEQMEPLIGNHHTNLEDGMIIAPCTNHNQCPMYTFAGQATGRKDFCRFSQRYERPPFLQRMVGARFHNTEHISYSYLAVQRGKDQRKEQGFAQNRESTAAAFAGYEDKDVGQVAMQNLPRIMAPPLKRTGHITFDVCTPHGSLERWITPKSFSKQAYRDARKAKWGDLWALGAKTRLETPAKVGRPADDKKHSKIDFSSGAVFDSPLDEAIHNVQKVKKERKLGSRRKAKLSRQPKYANDTRKRLTEGEEDLD